MDISSFLIANNPVALDQLMKVINRALANRKTRDNTTNDVSSRSIMVLNLFIIESGYLRKITIVDLAGHERAARLEINEKRYKEMLFINECLAILMGTSKLISRGKQPDFTIHPITHFLSDSMGGECFRQ